jgi:hypothetical protein
MLDGVPDELYQWVATVRDSLTTAFAAMEARHAAHFGHRPEGAERGAHAAYFQSIPGANPAVLFRMLDGKPYDDLIWKAVRPEPETPQTAWTREVPA